MDARKSNNTEKTTPPEQRRFVTCSATSLGAETTRQQTLASRWSELLLLWVGYAKIHSLHSGSHYWDSPWPAALASRRLLPSLRELTAFPTRNKNLSPQPKVPAAILVENRWLPRAHRELVFSPRGRRHAARPITRRQTTRISQELPVLWRLRVNAHTTPKSSSRITGSRQLALFVPLSSSDPGGDADTGKRELRVEGWELQTWVHPGVAHTR
jgi:hypothetical protein